RNFLFPLLTMVKVSPYCVGWSVISNVTFGLTNFLISYTNVDGIDPWAVIGWIWFTSGLIGVLTGVYFWFKIGRVFFTAEYLDYSLRKIPTSSHQDPEVGESGYVYLSDGEKIPQPHLEDISLRAKILTLVGGVCVGLSQLMMKWAFATDPAASGPLTAVISSDILVIGVYCHFVYNEKLTWTQAVAILVVLTGLIIMGASFDSGVGGGKPLGFVYAILGMLSFAASIVCIRSSCIDGIDAWSGFIGRMGVMFFMGLIALGDSGLNGGFIVHDSSLWKDM
ncbi:hypothetical protein FOZ62_006269, partial [Perkinsus olseni]